MSDDLWYEIEKQYQNELNKIRNKVIKLFQDSIQEAIYDLSDPFSTWWEPTGRFKDAVRAKFDEDGSLLVYVDAELLNFNSIVNYQDTGKDSSSIVPWLLEEGHSGSFGTGMYRTYKGRHYLELAYEKIRNAYPELEIIIINERPDWI